MEEDKKWLFVKIALVLGVIGLIVYGIYSNNQNKLDVTKYDKDQFIAANQDNGEFDDLALGKDDAKVTVIEYADYQCPACGRYKSVFEGLVEKYPDDVKLIFRNFILPGHTDARAASAVALAAARQGKFWEMHAKIFERSDEWSGKSDQRAEVFETFARELKLDIDKFRDDLTSEQITKKIAFDMALGRAHKLNATPTIIINGETVSSEVWSDNAKLDELIKNLLK